MLDGEPPHQQEVGNAHFTANGDKRTTFWPAPLRSSPLSPSLLIVLPLSESECAKSRNAEMEEESARTHTLPHKIPSRNLIVPALNEWMVLTPTSVEK